MSDLVRNPEDRFSYDAAQLIFFYWIKCPFWLRKLNFCADHPISSLDGSVSSVSATAQAVQLLCVFSLVAKFEVSNHYENTPMQYTAIFQGCKNDNLQMKKMLYFSYFCSKHRLWVHVRTASLGQF